MGPPWLLQIYDEEERPRATPTYTTTTTDCNDYHDDDTTNDYDDQADEGGKEADPPRVVDHGRAVAEGHEHPAPEAHDLAVAPLQESAPGRSRRNVQHHSHRQGGA